MPSLAMRVPFRASVPDSATTRATFRTPHGGPTAYWELPKYSFAGRSVMQ